MREKGSLLHIEELFMSKARSF